MWPCGYHDLTDVFEYLSQDHIDAEVELRDAESGHVARPVVVYDEAECIRPKGHEGEHLFIGPLERADSEKAP